MAEIKDKLGLNYSNQFNIKGIEEAEIDLVLSPANDEVASLYGVISDGINPITDATVKVFDSKGVPFAHTLSDPTTGQYSFSNLDVGSYTVGVVADGSIANIIMGMDIDSRTYNGTVSGWIKDDEGNVVAGSFVGLYEMSEDSEGHITENLIATTKTNSAGQYLSAE